MKRNKAPRSVIQKILDEWDRAIPESVLLQQKQRQSRRLFLGQSLGLIGSVAITTRVMAKSSTNIKTTSPVLSEPWITLAVVQQQLFPRGQEVNASPGAADFNALAYLQTMLNTPDADTDEKQFILQGVNWLNGVANNQFGRAFIKLNHNDRESVLKTISGSEAGENWLSVLLTYIFEALLSDPVYGGNTHQLGWQWLEHQAGFPRPPANKKYWLVK